MVSPQPPSSRNSIELLPFVSAKMKKTYGIVVCILIIILDVTAGILGIQAEIAQNKVNHFKMWIFECKDPSYNAFKLGLAAAILLALAHAIANLVGGCIFVRSAQDYKGLSANKQLAAGSLIFAWIALIVGFSLLISGAMYNTRSRKSCGLAHNQLLSIGGIVCFVHGLFAVAYYVSVTAGQREDTKPPPQGNPAVATGHV
ncbi:hypothetical protein E5676_scaffold255G006840 [Cucumis melo var. makuwa]|uniref:Uncharacterized protein LOC103484578 n=2 Tax=Cucumis melo TaxID=3656 RepID=A0A1S3AZY5_CUCME|nr:protein DESIGUAL 2-like [Cucumis melo]KAA0052746.1 hypothetical protein E6C27_scaffold120G003610 [Cucumis melo var. makuwa]TYK13077.1 hypothetical protein E5676_scaffold255G006840 [Cucumis melo var. makuwa]